jgi:solute carrier family 25 phosphate transporter 3
MSHLFPKKETLQNSFYSPGAPQRPQTGPTPYQARPELYGAFSVVEDTKGKAKQLGAEASKDFEKASAKAQAKTGHIELYSGRYYAACTFGGLLACV